MQPNPRTRRSPHEGGFNGAAGLGGLSTNPTIGERVADLESRVDAAFDSMLTMFGVIVKKTGIRFSPETMALIDQDLQKALDSADPIRDTAYP